MSKEILDEREFELVNIIGAELGSNQRDLSKQMDLSLGATNMLIKRMINKGLIRINQLDKRKVKYLLTPKGFTEKMRKSVKYTLKTICSISLIKDKIKESVLGFYSKGERNFYVLGQSDLALLIEMVFSEQNITDYKIFYLNDLPKEYLDGCLLVCKENVIVTSGIAKYSVDLISELALDIHQMATVGEN